MASYRSKLTDLANVVAAQAPELLTASPSQSVEEVVKVPAPDPTVAETLATSFDPWFLSEGEVLFRYELVASLFTWLFEFAPTMSVLQAKSEGELDLILVRMASSSYFGLEYQFQMGFAGGITAYVTRWREFESPRGNTTYSAGFAEVGPLQVDTRGLPPGKTIGWATRYELIRRIIQACRLFLEHAPGRRSLYDDLSLRNIFVHLGPYVPNANRWMSVGVYAKLLHSMGTKGCKRYLKEVAAQRLEWELDPGVLVLALDEAHHRHWARYTAHALYTAYDSLDARDFLKHNASAYAYLNGE